MYRKNAWKKYQDSMNLVYDFAEGYKRFITTGKSERLAYLEALKILKEQGFKDLNEFKTLKVGDKVYLGNKGKNLVAFIIGEKDLEEGLRILGAHIDSPRLDLKQNPLYEKDGFTLLDTHYYGGVKKYQWTTIPLALVGVIYRKDGSFLEINIGDHEDDPVFGITDLLIHLSANQLQKPGATIIEGENLDVSFSSLPIFEEDKEKVKDYALKLLKDKYNIEEEDFLSAEIEVVPAGKARDYGIDRSMIAGYGHDDRCCAYTSLMAFIHEEKPTYTSCMILVDKEEVGSIGATGAESLFFENSIAKLFMILGASDALLKTRFALENSKMLSSDVSAAVDPLFPEVNETKNACYFGRGIVFNKYTGSRGKSGSNDASPEYVAWIRNILDNEGIYHQTAELGKVDQGGGGTIAYILGNYNMDVLDAGIAVLNMHAPMEIISKVDLYETYLAYRAFIIN